MSSNEYEVYDLRSTGPLSELDKVASNNANNAYFVTKLGDSQQAGTNDWTILGQNNSCETYYCTFEVTI